MAQLWLVCFLSLLIGFGSTVSLVDLKAKLFSQPEAFEVVKTLLDENNWPIAVPKENQHALQLVVNVGPTGIGKNFLATLIAEEFRKLCGLQADNFRNFRLNIHVIPRNRTSFIDFINNEYLPFIRSCSTFYCVVVFDDFQDHLASKDLEFLFNLKDFVWNDLAARNNLRMVLHIVTLEITSLIETIETRNKTSDKLLNLWFPACTKDGVAEATNQTETNAILKSVLDKFLDIESINLQIPKELKFELTVVRFDFLQRGHAEQYLTSAFDEVARRLKTVLYNFHKRRINVTIDVTSAILKIMIGNNKRLETSIVSRQPNTELAVALNGNHNCKYIEAHQRVTLLGFRAFHSLLAQVYAIGRFCPILAKQSNLKHIFITATSISDFETVFKCTGKPE